MLADLVREFCKENNYEVYENYQKTTPALTFGGETVGGEPYTTIGIVVKGDCDILGPLTDFLETKEVTDQIMDELDGFPLVDELGPDTYIYYFPAIQDYQPPQP